MKNYKIKRTIDAYLCRLFVAITILVMVSENTGLAESVTIGDQDFTNGYILTGIDEFNTHSVGEPAPFDLPRGSDYGNPFSASWTFNYSPLIVTSASLTLGIVDHDSKAPGSQISSFTVDSIDITSLLDAKFESSGGSQGEYNIYSINLPILTFSNLSDGAATFTLTLQGPGLQQGGSTTSGNGAGLDFATLTIVPEPATICLLGFGAMGLLRRRRA
jgi:hypothetical protein